LICWQPAAGQIAAVRPDADDIEVIVGEMARR
jgi:hypothetical protein